MYRIFNHLLSLGVNVIPFIELSYNVKLNLLCRMKKKRCKESQSWMQFSVESSLAW